MERGGNGESKAVLVLTEQLLDAKVVVGRSNTCSGVLVCVVT